MSAEIIIGDFNTRLDLPPERILNSALEKGLESVAVVGWDADGKLQCWASSADLAATLLLLELAKKRLMTWADDE